MGILTYDNNKFLMDGKPYRIISGSVHYFRTVPEYWEDRLSKLKACGFNTVETYTAWNLHERREGSFDFSGMLDIERFLSIAKELDLNVILRPGPYICAEWDFGGLPSWLLSYPDIRLRCNNPLYLQKVRPYYNELLRRVRPYLCTNGGNIIMVQIENEYGSYGDDTSYLEEIKKMYIESGIDCVLFTSDGTNLSMLSGGSLDGVLTTANFGSSVKERFDELKAFRANQPLMCTEFWCGWFDHWYEEHHTRKSDSVIQETEEFFESDASFNMYMFHGGTNFGFTNGANHTGELYQPTVTSYDYCAPLNEAGDMTDTYFNVKKCIEKYTGTVVPMGNISNTRKCSYGTVILDKCAPLFDNIDCLSECVYNEFPQTMEELGQDFGYLVYSTVINGPCEPLELIFPKLHDRAHIFVNGVLAGIRERSRRKDSVQIELGMGESLRMDILVENMGRINYGPKLMEHKGICGGISLGERRYHYGWKHYPLTMDNLSELNWECKKEACVPAFFKGSFNIDDIPGDSFVCMEGFEKGFCVVNGFNIGRYYNSAGPQKTLYVPAPVLKKGLNEIIIFETDKCTEPKVTFYDKADLG